MMFSKVRVLALVSAVAAVHSAAVADTVTLEPPSGVTTNVLSLFTGDTAVEVAGPGAVKLNPSNTHTGGTTLSGGTLILTGDIPAGGPSPVGTGTFTVSGGTLLGSGSFGGDITGTGAFSIEAQDGWALSGRNSFAEPVTVSSGTLEIAGGTTAFSKHMYLLDSAAYSQTGGAVTMGANNVQLSYANGATSSFAMTGGTFDANGKNVVIGYKVTNAKNTFDVSGSAVFYNAGSIYTYSGSGNIMNINVYDGGTLDCSAIYNGNDTTGTAKTNLRVNGGMLRCNKKGSSATSYALWIGHTSVKRQLTSFTIGPKGASFTTDNGDAAGVMQIYSPITAEPAGAGETAVGVTITGGRFAYCAPTAYEGPTIIKDGAALYLSSDGTIPSSSAVTIKGGSMLRLLGTDKTISALTLENGATLGFGTPSSSANSAALTVSGSVTLPSEAQIALYTLDTPDGVAKNANGTYAVLKVPASYADALRAVSWSCATATSGKSYTFSVATTGGTATLSMTIAAASVTYPLAVSDDMVLVDTLNVSGDITIGSGATLAAAPIYGSATGGSITINNGGTLDASGDIIRPVNTSGNSFHLYLNEGGTLVVNQISGVTSGAAANEAQATAMFHFNGGTIYPLAFGPSDANRYLLNYQTAVVGANGLTIDMSRWMRPEGYTKWVRSSLQGNVNHDPTCAGTDGGITVKATGDERALVCFGSRFAGSNLTGGIHVEDGGIIAPHAAAFGGLSLVLEPGARFRPYDSTSTIRIGDLTIGKANATKPVAFDGSSNTASNNVVVSETLSVLSPVEFSVTPGWNYDSTLSSGTYTALVYKATCSVDTTLFRLPANAPTGATLAAEEVILTGGDYDGWKALVVTTANDLPLQNGAPATISDGGDYAYGNIYVGDFGVVANNTLTVSDGTVTADTLHLAYQPGIGTSAADGVHLDVFNQTGGKVSVQTLQTHWVGKNSEDTSGRADTEINLSGGLLEVAGNVELAYNRMKSGRTSTINVSGGRLAVGGDLLLIRYSGGAFTAAGILNVTDGEVDVKGIVDLSRTKNQATGTKNGGIWLRGGVLKAENVIQTTNECPYAHFYFDGGTYAPYGAAAANRTMQGLNKAYVSTNGAIIDTSALPAGATYTIAQTLLTDPALNGAEDGGLVKKGAGTLALSGANTYTGPTKVEAGTLVAANADVLSSCVEVADGAVLDLGASGATVARIAASGAVAGNLTVTDAIVLGDECSILSVSGNLEIANRAAIDFGLANGDEPPSGWTPVAAVSGEITRPNALRVRNAGDFNRCKTSVAGGVLYVRPTKTGMVLIIR